MSENNSNQLHAFLGYFKAPGNGTYRFLMSCDDSCTMSLSTDQPWDPSAKERLLTRGTYTHWRNFYLTDKTGDDNPNLGIIYSRWVNLTQDEYYYFETTVKNNNGPGHLTVGMEAMLDTMPTSHPNFETQI